jgi:hypothetical protein
MTVQYLHGLNIYVITELTIATLFARVLVMRHQTSFSFFAFQAVSLMASWKTIEPPSSFFASYLTHQSSSIIAMIRVTREAWRLRVPTMRSKDILHQAKWGSSWSSPLRKNGSPDNQEGEADPVAQWRPRVSKLQLKGLSHYHSNEISVEEPDRGQWAE